MISLEAGSEGSGEAVSRALVLPSNIALHIIKCDFTDTTRDLRLSAHHLLLATFLAKNRKLFSFDQIFTSVVHFTTVNADMTEFRARRPSDLVEDQCQNVVEL